MNTDAPPDNATLAAYDAHAAEYAYDWHGQPVPDDMQRLLLRYFSPGRTADIGCGSGRDVAWLHAHGFDAVGFDASEGLLAEARRRYPALRFAQAALPGLAGLADGEFANVLCETVIMHLPREALGPALDSLLRVLAAGGVLYLSWRVVDGEDERDGRGRLYAAVDRREVLRHFRHAAILHDETSTSASSGKRIHRLIVRK